MAKLTPKQARFIDEYLIDFNGTQAYMRAGYKAKNEDSAAVLASKLLRNVKVQEAIQAAQAKLSEACLVTQKMVIEGLKSEATLSGEGSIHSARVSAWGLLGKHLGMFVEKTENKTELVVKSGLEDFYGNSNA